MKRVYRPTEPEKNRKPDSAFDRDRKTFSEAEPRQIVRYPLHYSRPFTSDINYERLPKHEEIQDMGLAYRETAVPLDVMKHIASSWLISLFFLTAIVSVSVGVCLTFVRPAILTIAMPASAMVGFFWALALAGRKRLTIRGLIFSLSFPIFVGGVLTALFFLFEFRLLASCVLLLASGVVIILFAHHIIYFYQEWLLTAPHLTPADRRELRIRFRKMKRTRPKIFFPSMALISVALLPLFSFSLAIGIATFCLLMPTIIAFVRGGTVETLRWRYIRFCEILGIYLLYGKASSKAPGVWSPSINHNFRALILVLAAILPTATLALATQGFFPWDFPYVWGELFEGDERQQALKNLTNGWVLISTQAIIDGKYRYVYCFSVALFLSVVLPTLFFHSVFDRITHGVNDCSKLINELLNDERTEWQWYVDRIRSSGHRAFDPLLGGAVYENGHLFLGIEPNADHPVLLDRRILAEHAHITGESGSGKTSLGIMPLLIQLIRGGSDGVFDPTIEIVEKTTTAQLKCPACSATLFVDLTYPADQAPCPKCPNILEVRVAIERTKARIERESMPPIVVIDLKGDPALFHTVRAEAEAKNPGCFRWFTPEAGFSSHYFNPFLGLASDTRTLAQVCELLLESLGMSHGDGYGRSYFTRQNRSAILSALKTEPAPKSFEELNAAIVKIVAQNPKQYEDIGEVVSTLQMLAEYPQLSLFQPLKDPSQAIHMPSVLENRQVVYFWLPAALESVSVREIGRLALYSLISAAIERQRRGLGVRQCYLIIDEFQRIAGENFKIILEQARSFGVGVVLANQTAADLNMPSFDLRPTVNTNTRLKMVFSVSDPFEMRSLQNISGEELVETRSYQLDDVLNENPLDSIMGSVQEFVKPRLTTGDILSVNDHPLDFFMQVSRGSGYTQYRGLPIHVRATWPIKQELYQYRSEKETWPEFEPYELEQERGVVSETSPQEIDRKKEAWSSQFEELLQGVFARYENQSGSGDVDS